MKINLNTLLNVLLAVVLILLAVRYFNSRPRFVNGEQAPDFTLTTTAGERVQLSDLKGQYVLLDFWGSWCGPCRRQNPRLVQLYQKYGGAGFEIVSVALENDLRSWRQAIAADGLNWPYHTLDRSAGPDRADLSISELYGVQVIPTKYLLDDKGVIIGVNQSPAAIDRFLAKNLKQTTEK